MSVEDYKTLRLRLYEAISEVFRSGNVDTLVDALHMGLGQAPWSVGL